MNNKLNALKFAVAGGIWVGACAALSTVSALLKIPGFTEFTQLIQSFYGFWGYKVSVAGIFIGAFWGFVEGFVHLGFLALVYNWLVGEK